MITAAEHPGGAATAPVQTLDQAAVYRSSRLHGSSVWATYRAGLLIFSAILAIGLGNAPAIAGCNSGAGANSTLLSDANCQADASGNNTTAVGAGAQATGLSGTTYGASSIANGDRSTSMGVTSGSIFATPGQTSLGFHTNQLSTGVYATAVGTDANANGNYSIAIGGGDGGVGTSAALANGASATAVGVSSSADGNFSSAFGNTARATAVNSTAIGTNSTAGAASSSAFGDTANATAANATAIGAHSTAGFANSTAIGTGANTTAANQIAVGTASNTYRMAGITSAASLAAQSGPTSFVTTDAAGNLAATSFNPGSVAALDGRVTALENNVNNLNFNVRKAFEGAAVAIAMGGSALPDNKRFAISANWGNFSGENAFGGMAQMRISNNFVANAAVGAGFARGGVGGRVGGTFAW